MDFQFVLDSEQLGNFTKCGYIYRYPAAGGNRQLMLKCLHCDETSWQLENFLEHSFSHLDAEIEEDSLDIEGPIFETQTKIKCRSETLTSNSLEQKQDDNDGKDPLEERDNEVFVDLIPDAIKAEYIEGIEKLVTVDGNGTVNDPEFVPDGSSDVCEVNAEDYSDNNSESNARHHNLLDVDDAQDKEEINLKRFTKNRPFTKFFIQLYKQQVSLWHTPTKCGRPKIKFQGLTAIAHEINKKFNTNTTTKQVEMIIKRLRMRFIHQYRLKHRMSDNASDQNVKPLWFYDQLKFLEPHIKDSKQKTSICNELTDDQLLTLIRLLKDNDCFWNADNIYHTSVMHKQETLKEILNSYAYVCNQPYTTVNDIRNIIEELKDVVVNENRHRLECKKNHTINLYEPQHRFFKELEFLLPHVGPFVCSQCDKSFIDIYAYKFHVSKHDGTKPFKCMVCYKELTHKKEFMCHLRRHTKECPFKCDMCDKSFPSKKERQRHVIKHGSKPYVCELCADSFYTQHQLTNHMKNHANIRDHVCAQCGKGFTHRGLLRQHLQTHNKTECICPTCNNVYANPRSLRKHYLRVHETSQEARVSNHSCKICMITFPTIQEAKQHRKEHKQSLPVKRKHVCDICGHDFAYPRNLADHKKTHSNVRDQVCDLCGKAFTNANLLNQHKNVHNGQKFVCKVCGKDYAHYRGLCRHITKAHNSCVKDVNNVKKVSA